MADAGDLKSPARYGRVGSNPTSAITEDRKKTVIKSVKDCMYITKDEHKRLDNGYDEVNAMLYCLMNNWQSFSDF